MSSFLSNKFLQYRAGSGQTIDVDVYCTTCGYNLRGLNYGRNCPECGQQIKRTGGLRDALISGEIPQRQGMWLGLTLVTACLFVAALARLGLWIALVFTPISVENAYLALGLANAAAWIAGVWLLTPQHLDSHYYKLRWLRLTARWSQLLWPVGYALWLMAVTLPTGTASADRAAAWSILVRGVAGIGALFFAAWLLRLAADAELEIAARRINLAIWALPIPTILLAGLPDQVPWIALVLIGMVLLVWCWFVLLLARGVLVMQRHVAWAIKLAGRLQERGDRIATTRERMDRRVAANVRPPPAPSPDDVPIIKKD